MTITAKGTLPRLKKFYLGSMDISSMWLPKYVAELSITFNQQIVNVHYGATEFISHNTGVTQLYVIPEDVREAPPRWDGSMGCLRIFPTD